ncbi:uncharacterized protein LOC125675336 [Ostrea edulis]|uniref:uncharacterized protein LOC125675336 n=1 Tax=Ostrea edulis TaxID=37623 RepID=UPI0024AE9FD3|nr:uncharacterized protein LOC125675336 [Ostrea edulis]
MDSPSITLQIHTGIQHTSESVFMGLCRTVGTSQQVAMRRDLIDIAEMVRNKVMTSNQGIMMSSGSHREGFRMKGSDRDFMKWFNNHRVIWDLSQIQLYNIHKHSLILSVSSENPPGFTLLQLLTHTAHKNILSPLVTMNGGRYISSSKYREITCFEIKPNSTVHGPCSSGTIRGKEYDIANCFACDFWPPPASPWIDRCHTWPQPQVVRDIVRGGCHFVAIGHKLGNHENNEWRISFSLAEQKLVYSMNHCQFLTYGLLKLFLKEVINNGLGDNEKLLCSYHMKTAVFWTIQQSTIPNWCPQNLLKCFWYCFKLILKWVYEGVCPNFFIPKNNMFLSNIHGQAQNRLFVRLFGFYEEGLASLLRSPALRSYIVNVLYNPRLSICTDEHTLVSEIKFDKDMFMELYSGNSLSSSNPYLNMVFLNTIEQLIVSPLTQCQVLMLQVLTASLLRSTAFTSQKMYSSTTKNKLMYIADRMSCHMLKLTAKFGCISDRLYIAMYYYKTLRYTEALSVIEMTKVNLAQPYVMHNWTVDTKRYTEAVGGQSWSTKFRHAVVWYIILTNRTIYFNELITEQSVSLQNQFTQMIIPPLVMLHMLEFLCYRHIDTRRAQTALNDLQVLVHHDQGVYVGVELRDISWQILGICQHISGNLEAALYSYQQSLRQYPYSRIQSATLMRILSIVYVALNMTANDTPSRRISDAV